MTGTKTSHDLSEIEFLGYVEEQSKAEAPYISENDMLRLKKMSEEAGISAHQFYGFEHTTAKKVDGYVFLRQNRMQPVLDAIWKKRLPEKVVAGG